MQTQNNHQSSHPPDDQVHEVTKHRVTALEFLGLKIDPFPLTPRTDDLYVSSDVNQIIAEIVDGIMTRRGFMVLTGEIGLGKTTISRKIMTLLDEDEISSALVFHTFFQELDLIKEINRDFGLEADKSSLMDELRELSKFLIDQHRQGRNCVIIIDDAQNLSIRSLELIRLISNLETAQHKLVQIVLVGQPELLEKLNSPELRQLKSRIFFEKTVQPLTPRNLKKYIYFKLYSAGDRGKIDLRNRTIRYVHKLTGGNIRQVNILMARALSAAFHHNSTRITKRLFKTVGLELHMIQPFRPRPWLQFCGLGVLFLAIGLTGMIAGGFLPIDLPALDDQVRKVVGHQKLSPAASFDRHAKTKSAFEMAAPFAEIGEAQAGIALPGGEGQPDSEKETTKAGFAGDAAEDLFSLEKMVQPQQTPRASANDYGESARDRGDQTTRMPPDVVPENHGGLNPAIPAAVTEFMAAYQLEQYADPFYQALSAGFLEDIAATIYQKEGYQVIILPAVPENVRNNFDLLRFPPVIFEKEMGTFGLFWRPGLTISKFYWGYEGEEIIRLQELLEEAGYYAYEADGIVGKYLMSAVINFQKEFGLTVTGFPGRRTLFLLNNLDMVASFIPRPLPAENPGNLNPE